MTNLLATKSENSMDKFIKAQLFDAHSRVNKGFNEVFTICKQLKSDIPMHSENEKRLDTLIDNLPLLLHQINVDFQTIFERYRLFLDEV